MRSHSPKNGAGSLPAKASRAANGHSTSWRGYRRRSRLWRPIVEGLEFRTLATSHVLSEVTPGRHLPAADVQQFVPLLYPPGTPQPTPAEIKRESFVVKAVGKYAIGPGRFDTQSITIHGYGRPAISNLSERMHFQFIIFEPANPSQPVTGEMNFIGLDFLNNGTQFILDLMGPTGTEVHGLPTHLYWAHDAASSGPASGTGSALPGYFNFPTNYFNAQGVPTPPTGAPGNEPSSVDNWNLGLGDARFSYIPDRHPAPHTLGSGRVMLVFRGLLNYSGAASTADKQYN
jgi:hypothetical protein